MSEKLTKTQIERVECSMRNEMDKKVIAFQNKISTCKEPSDQTFISEARKSPKIFTAMIIDCYFDNKYIDVSNVFKKLPLFVKQREKYEKMLSEIKPRMDKYKATLLSYIKDSIDMLYLGKADPVKVLASFKKFEPNIK